MVSAALVPDTRSTPFLVRMSMAARLVNETLFFSFDSAILFVLSIFTPT